MYILYLHSPNSQFAVRVRDNNGRMGILILAESGITRSCFMPDLFINSSSLLDETYANVRGNVWNVVAPPYLFKPLNGG